MVDHQHSRPRAQYRFDPHTQGIFLGLGRIRMTALLVVLALGVLALYRGALLGAAVFLAVAPVVVIWTREGIPALVWIPMRLWHALADREARGWSLDPELVPHADPLSQTGSSTTEH